MLFFKKIVSTNRQGAELHFWRWVAAHILCSKAHKQKRGSSAKRKPLFYTHQNKTERHPNGFLYPWGCLLSYCVFALCRLPQPSNQSEFWKFRLIGGLRQWWKYNSSSSAWYPCNLQRNANQCVFGIDEIAVTFLPSSLKSGIIIPLR